jgi:hypothetical protein
MLSGGDWVIPHLNGLAYRALCGSSDNQSAVVKGRSTGPPVPLSPVRWDRTLLHPIDDFPCKLVEGIKTPSGGKSMQPL